VVDDKAPDGPVDFSTVPDAVPRQENRSKYGNPETYVVFGKRYRTLSDAQGYRERGIASWYGTKFHGRRTSSGEPYDMYAMTAAHKTLPLPVYARVTNLKNGRSVVVKVNDRGPFHDNRLIDLSYVAAGKLGILKAGTGLVEVEVIDSADAQPKPPPTRVATRQQDPGAMAAPVTEQPARTGPPSPEFYLQVGAFGNQFNAERMRNRLRSDIDQAIRIERSAEAMREIYRVQVGPVGSVEQADDLSERLASLGIREMRIVVECAPGTC
jgi:rare lipoprotein A